MRFTFVPVQEVSVPIDYTEYPSEDGSIVIGEKPHDEKRKTR